jgi:protein-tyrosine phosphatase
MFQIFEVAVGTGFLGISPLPGRSGRYDEDLIKIFQWNPSIVFTMTTMAEMERGRAGTLKSDLTTAGVQWAHLPVPDFGAPPDETEALWRDASSRAHKALSNNGRVLAHCYGGCGRSGMAVLRLMAEAGEDPEVALQRLRDVRPCAVETDAQYQWAAAGFSQ